MAVFRRHLLRHRHLAAWAIAAALLMRMLVPTGYMIGGAGGALTILLCPGYAPTPDAAMPGMAHHAGQAHHQDGREHPGKHSGGEMPCAFSGLSAPSLGGADPLLLALAIAFVVATAFRAPDREGPPGAQPFLRPPLRGPPSLLSVRP